MSKQKNEFVLSSKKFPSIKEIERKATGYLMGGKFDQKCRMFRVVEEYRPEIRFIKVK